MNYIDHEEMLSMAQEHFKDDEYAKAEPILNQLVLKTPSHLMFSTCLAPYFTKMESSAKRFDLLNVLWSWIPPLPGCQCWIEYHTK